MTILYIGNILSKHGFTATTIETLGPKLESLGFTLIYASDKKNIVSRILDMVYKIWHKRKRIDKVLIDTYSSNAFWYTYISAMLCRILNISYLPILHGGRLPLRLIKNKLVTQQIFLHSEINLAPSNYLKVEFENFGFNTIFVPNSIDIKQYTYTKKRKNKLKILWVRSFASIYNPQMAIRVISELKYDINNIELCMVGPDKDGSMEQCKILAGELGVSDNIIFTGRLTKEEWLKLSADYYIFINTTNIDNTPVSVIEAMALGLPVVSTNVGGIPYLLEDRDDALLVNKGDSKQMKKAIKRLIDDDELYNKLSVNARKNVERFDWDVVKNDWLKILK